jgi:hypothetical protein
MQRAVPGSQLSVWIGSYGNPWTPAFSKEQVASAIASVDLFLFMDYSDCGQHNIGLANSAMTYIKAGFNFSVNTLGLPRSKLVAVWPWWACDFNCGAADADCAGLQYSCDGRNCKNNVSSLGYQQLLPSLALSKAQGRGRQWNSTWTSPFYNYKNESTAEGHQVWYDDKDSLKLKYSWSLQEAGLRGVGMWTPGATLFDDKATSDMWSTVPARVPAGAKTDDRAAERRIERQFRSHGPVPGVRRGSMAARVAAVSVPPADAATWSGLNARDFGAKGDGVTDDSAALQLAIDAALNQSHQLLVPAGIYMIMRQLNVSMSSCVNANLGCTMGLTMRGEGQHLTEIHAGVKMHAVLNFTCLSGPSK